MIKGEVFLNLFILALGLFCIDHFFKPDYSGKIFTSIVLILSLLYIFIRLWYYIQWRRDSDREYARPGILPVLGEGFIPDFSKCDNREVAHPRANSFWRFMPLFFIAFVINKTIFAIYRKAKDWSNNYLTIKLNEDGN